MYCQNLGPVFSLKNVSEWTQIMIALFDEVLAEITKVEDIWEHFKN